jgi:PAS domain S-box-containing protein
MSKEAPLPGWTMRREPEQTPFTRLLAEAFAPVDEAVTLADTDGYIIEANRAVERVYGWKRDDVVGFHPLKFCPDLPNFKWDELSRKIWQSVKEQRRWDGVVINHDKDKKRFPILLKIRRITDDKKEYILSFARPFPLEAPWGLKRKQAEIFLKLGSGDGIKAIGKHSTVSSAMKAIRGKIRKQNCLRCPKTGCPFASRAGGSKSECGSTTPLETNDSLTAAAITCRQAGWDTEMKLENTEMLKHLQQSAEPPKRKRFNPNAKYAGV